MKKTIACFLLITFLFQSCYTYKTVTTAQLLPKKNYVVKIKKGTIFNAEFKEIYKDSLTLLINNNTVKIPITEIEEIKREKASALKLVGGGILFTAGILFLINDAPKSTFLGTDEK